MTWGMALSSRVGNGFFQSLEMLRGVFPIVGNFWRGFSNRWKLLLAVGVAAAGVCGEAAGQCVTLEDATHAPGFSWTTYGDASWFAQTNFVREADSCAAQAGGVDHSGVSWLETVVTNTGMLSFYWKVSSEEGWDYLTLYVNQENGGEISGEVGWTYKQYELTANVSTLRWRYAKDESQSVGEDTGWMTDFVFQPFTGRFIVVTGDLNFGRVELNATNQRPLAVINRGDEAVSVSNIVMPASFSASPTVFTVNPGETNVVTISFEPLTAGLVTGQVEVVSDAQSCVAVRDISGRGVIVGHRYVWTNSPTPMVPYTNWETAAHTIQAAVDEAGEDDVVWVTNGVYDAGGAVLLGQTNRVVVGTGVTVRSVNGPVVTHIVGAADPAASNAYGLGAGAVRGVVLMSNAVLDGFTVRDGHTVENNGNGGGVFGSIGEANNLTEALSLLPLVTNCIIQDNAAAYGGGACVVECRNSVVVSNEASRRGGGVYYAAGYDTQLKGNSAYQYGGGAAYVIMENCRIEKNTAQRGGGACMVERLYNCVIIDNEAEQYGGGVAQGYDMPMENCTVIGNRAMRAGGVWMSAMRNCVVYGNTANEYPNVAAIEWMEHCCTTPDEEDQPGTSNIYASPGLAGGTVPHLLSGSPCVNTGTNQSWMTGAVDLDGEGRIGDLIVDIGADEYWAGGVTDTLYAVIGLPLGDEVTPGFALPFYSDVSGRCERIVWDMGDGTRYTNEAMLSHAYEAVGDYEVWLYASNAVSQSACAVTVRVWNAWYYVATNGSDSAAGTNWSTAKQTIQGAVDACQAPGGMVWVTNGVYDRGGSSLKGHSNRVTAAQYVSIRSVNGPAVTEIRGAADTTVTNEYGCGSNAVRCVYLGKDAGISGFTLSDGHSAGVGMNVPVGAAHERADKGVPAMKGYMWIGGGVWCESSNNVISNCVITGCSAEGYAGGVMDGTVVNSIIQSNRCGLIGGGTYASILQSCRVLDNEAKQEGGGIAIGTARNCLISGNKADYAGGGGVQVQLDSCTVVGNRALTGGGFVDGLCLNSIVYYNEARSGANWEPDAYADIQYSCTTPLPAGGTENTDTPPQISGFTRARLLATSPCLGMGSTQAWMSAAVDCDGEPRMMGYLCDAGWDQYWPDACTGALTAVITAPNGLRTLPGEALALLADITEGNARNMTWSLDGAVVNTNETRLSLSWTNEGDHVVSLLAANPLFTAGAVVTVRVVNAVQHVAPSGNDAAAGTNWATAKQTIQAAVDASLKNGLILVSNGVYDTGARLFGGPTTSNRVVLTNGVLLRSVNGPDVTVIAGNADTDEGSSNAVRGVYMDQGTRLEGFTITNGNTIVDEENSQLGGGVFAVDETAVISNCVITHCFSTYMGGGVRDGTYWNCRIQNNTALAGGGGSMYADLHNCQVQGNTSMSSRGGGMYRGTADRCMIVSNVAVVDGGGASQAVIRNSVIQGNISSNRGGGLYNADAYNSLIIGNTSGGDSGGAYDSQLYQCTVVGNVGGIRSGLAANSVICGNTGVEWSGLPDFFYTCTRPLPEGPGCITNDPLMDAEYRLTAASPCINTGTNGGWVTQPGAMDLDGRVRLIGPRADMGCYEYPLSIGDAAVQKTGTVVRLNWSAIQGADGYVIFRSPAAGGPAVQQTVPGSDATSWTDTDVQRGETYSYTLCALYGNSTSDVSSVLTARMMAVELDFDGDQLADISVYQPAQGQWSILQSLLQAGRFQSWGWEQAWPVPGDYDGDGKCDVAVYAPANGAWYIWQSATQSTRIQNWGWEQAWPVPGDYDGDGITDCAVYDFNGGAWLILQSSTGTLLVQPWGWNEALPVPGDYDGDGKTDCAVYAPEYGLWYIWQSASRTGRVQWWGSADDEPIPGDYDGDGITDLAVYRAALGMWYILHSSTGAMIVDYWGWNDALPVAADYDGDGRYDRTVYAPAFGMWYLWLSAGQTSRSQPWGFEEADPVK